MNINEESGFTLVEIMIVVLILGMLTAISMPSFIKARTETNKNVCIATLIQLNSAVQQYSMSQKSTNMPPDLTPSLDVFFQNQAPTNCTSGGEYSLPVDANCVPECDQYFIGHWIRGG